MLPAFLAEPVWAIWREYYHGPACHRGVRCSPPLNPACGPAKTAIFLSMKTTKASLHFRRAPLFSRLFAPVSTVESSRSIQTPVCACMKKNAYIYIYLLHTYTQPPVLIGLLRPGVRWPPIVAAASRNLAIFQRLQTPAFKGALRSKLGRIQDHVTGPVFSKDVKLH